MSAAIDPQGTVKPANWDEVLKAGVSGGPARGLCETVVRDYLNDLCRTGGAGKREVAELVELQRHWDWLGPIVAPYVHAIRVSLGYLEQHRKMVVSALLFLAEQEASWHLDRPIDQLAYLNELVRQAGVKS
jgi:hypothetical protein